MAHNLEGSSTFTETLSQGVPASSFLSLRRQPQHHVIQINSFLSESCVTKAELGKMAQHSEGEPYPQLILGKMLGCQLNATLKEATHWKVF